MDRIRRITASNFRCIRSATVDVGDITILFGPNGAGKSTWLDIVWFIRDCCIRGVPEASADRNHGIGMLWSKAEGTEGIELGMETDRLHYRLHIDFENGRINPYPNEEWTNLGDGSRVLQRESGSTSFQLLDENGKDFGVPLLEPEKLAISQYLSGENRHDPGIRPSLADDKDQAARDG